MIDSYNYSYLSLLIIIENATAANVEQALNLYAQSKISLILLMYMYLQYPLRVIHITDVHLCILVPWVEVICNKFIISWKNPL